MINILIQISALISFSFWYEKVWDKQQAQNLFKVKKWQGGTGDYKHKPYI